MNDAGGENLRLGWNDKISFLYMPQFQYKQQQFQQAAVNAVADMFRGIDIGRFQPSSPYALSKKQNTATQPPDEFKADNAQRPLDFMSSFFKETLKNNLQDIQQRNGIIPSPLCGDGDYLKLDTQMETGTGKTFVFINTIFELHKRYGLTHFVVIVPSIAIKENAKKSFDTTQPYFQRLYQRQIKVVEMGKSKGRKGRKPPPAGVMEFIHSQQLTVLIMTNHAFNRSDQNLINQELESFYADNARTPMDAIAAKHPVLIIDEPQRVEGGKTSALLKNFNPLFALRYSATFREGQIKNLIYVLDAYDSFHNKLVKGVTVTDYKIGAADGAFLGVRNIRKANGQLQAELEAADNNGNLRQVNTGVEKNGDGKLFAKTSNPAYRDLRVTKINQRDNEVEFSDGKTLQVGEYAGRNEHNDEAIAEAMLRDAITKHMEKEERLLARGIKCLSLIFIDRVRDYRDYADDDTRGWLQTLFERCYQEQAQRRIKSTAIAPEYRAFLKQQQAADAHGGYFSADAKNNGKIDAGATERSDDTARKIQQEISDLILRDKEKILQTSNPLRFIFAHSALREGWDNPNVFQICKLRSGYSSTGVVQEVGRGLRICVNDKLERQDESVIGGDFAAFNRLDVFTLGNGDFIRRLQQELSDRRCAAKAAAATLTPENLRDLYEFNIPQANKVWNALYNAGCVDDNGRWQNLHSIAGVLLAENLDPQRLAPRLPSYLPLPPKVGDGREQHSTARAYHASRNHYQQFKQLWELLHQNVIYEVKYSDDFERKAATAINDIKSITPLRIYRDTKKVDTQNDDFKTTTAQEGTVAETTLTSSMTTKTFLNQLAEKTNLPRNTVIRILSAVENEKYRAMRENPYLAAQEVADTINRVIYENIVDNIRYHRTDGLRESTVTLTDRQFEAKHYIVLDDLPRYENNNLWEEIAPYDSEDPERKISENALGNAEITVFAKLPRAVKIPAPMHPNGINPDFACVVRGQNDAKHFYFVAEAKPTTAIKELRGEEKRRVCFMRKYFRDICGSSVRFDVISNYDQLLGMFNKARGE